MPTVVDAAAASSQDSAQLLGWSVVSTVLLLGLLSAAVRIIPPYERAVVLRFGRFARLGGPGLCLALPGAERLVRVPLVDSLLEPLVAHTSTLDGVRVHVSASARYRILDPARWCLAVPDGYARTVATVEAALRADVDRAALSELAHYPGAREARVLEEVNAVVGAWGVVVSDLDAVGIDVSVDAQLLRWARSLDHTPEPDEHRAAAEGDRTCPTSPTP